MARIVPLHLLDPSPENPRRKAGAKALRELAASVLEHGVLEPLIVEATGDRFLVVAGHRRLQAAELAGLDAVPVEVREPRDACDRFAAMVVENVQREQLTAREKAEAYRRMIDVYGLTQTQVAQRVGLHPSTISNTLKTLRPPEVLEAERLERYRLRDAGKATRGKPTVDASAKACLQRLRHSVDSGTTAMLTPMQCRTVLAMLTRAASAVREARAGDQAVA